MMLRPSAAARRRSSSAALAALPSRAWRQAFSRSICSYSTLSFTVRICSPSPPESGESSVVVKTLTPTILVSPDSIARMRAVLLSTRQRFMYAITSSDVPPPMAMTRASSARASSFSASTLRSISFEPSKMSP